MKKLIAALLTTLISTLCAISADWANFARYEQANKTSPKSPQAVLLGDSITDNWARKRGEFFSGNNLVGRGISGQVTSQMLVRMRRDVLDLKPKFVAILAGTNDIAKNNGDISIENIYGNIVSMAEISKLHGIKVAICSVLPVYEYPWRKEVKNPSDQIKKLNSMLKKYADENGCIYVDYHSRMADARGGLPQNLAKDGVHPTNEGYAVMEKILLETLEKNK